MKLTCAFGEEQWVTMTRFMNVLMDDLRGEECVHYPESSLEAYQKALEIEKYKEAISFS